MLPAIHQAYEAAGSAGIINIILKDAGAKSYDGQVSALVGSPTDYKLNASFSRSEGKWSYFGNAGLRYSDYISTGVAERISQLPTGTQILLEDLDQNRNDRAGNAFGGFDFRPTEKTTLSASYSYYHQRNDDLSSANYTYSDGVGELEQDWLQCYDYLEPENYNQIEASWAQPFFKEDSKLLVLFQNYFWNYAEHELTIVRESFPSTSEVLSLRTHDLKSSTEYLLQSDYEQKLGKNWEVGIRPARRDA